MPLYDYKCESCNHEFTETHSISNRKDPEHSPCPNCSSKGYVKQIIKFAPIVGYSIAPGLRTSDNFNDRLKEIKKTKGKDETISQVIR